ncbi:Protein kinase, putative [Hondaea fermentalgiana]|uniref:non-specific serine/threonine protein kinase n=1 Tax=Hondaea fermentalgiana TaxID=2315210 RepID=A0A2R5GHN1_9STRA|nr:Protein kinase, putative [Hondaea fermentalgiana]|eukprot:GBG27384.1 Protein kinase, putative [Hondaea fermentalgiana]
MLRKRESSSSTLQQQLQQQQLQQELSNAESDASGDGDSATPSGTEAANGAGQIAQALSPSTDSAEPFCEGLDGDDQTPDGCAVHALQEGAYARIFVAHAPNSLEGADLIAIKEFKNTPQAREESRRELEALQILWGGNLSNNSNNNSNGNGEESIGVFVIKLLFVNDEGPHAPLRFGLEFCPAGDLFTLIREQDLSEVDIAFYVAEIAVALEYVHAHGIVHGDLKPENVCIAANGHIRLIDFGVSSRILDASPDDDLQFVERGKRLVVTSSGTLDYASPEQIMRMLHSFEADWWSLGVVLYEMIFGDVPFTNPDREACAVDICTVPIAFPSDVEASDAVCHLTSCLLHKDRRHRLGFAAGLAELQNHPFFSWVDWNILEIQGYQPPFLVSDSGED